MKRRMTDKTEIYFAAPEKNSLMECYIIKTGGGRLVVIDGGIDGEGRDRPPFLGYALRAVTGLCEDDPLTVDAWFLSHAHCDHFRELGKLMSACKSPEQLTVNRFIFDFPPYETDEFPFRGGDEQMFSDLKAGFDHYAALHGIAYSGESYFDAVNGCNVSGKMIEAGQVIDVDGVKFEMMQTWDISDGTDTNSSSLVFRMHANGKTMLFLHDLGRSGGRRLLEKYGEALRSDAVHMAHHGQAGVDEDVYRAINAEKRVWGTPAWVWSNTRDYRIGETRRWVNGDEDFTAATDNDVVTCLYPCYPDDPYSVASWSKVLPCMKITL